MHLDPLCLQTKIFNIIKQLCIFFTDLPSQLLLRPVPRVLHPQHLLLDGGARHLELINLKLLSLVIEMLVPVDFLEGFYLPPQSGLVLRAHLLDLSDPLVDLIEHLESLPLLQDYEFHLLDLLLHDN